MPLLRKICQRIGDPVFYRKKIRDLRRACIGGLQDEPGSRDLSDLGDIQSALLVVAHPDDETFCSGLICGLVESGASVEVVCLTRGEGGPTGSYSREEIGSVREQEMRKSCDALGITKVTFLDLVDPVARGYRVFAPLISSAELTSQLLPFLEGNQLVVSHGSSGEYWHPAHLLVYDAVRKAIPASGVSHWLTFLARDPAHPMQRLLNQDDPTDLRVDVSSMREKRLSALSNHTSQLGLFGRFAEGTHEDFIDKTATESYRWIRISTDRESG